MSLATELKAEVKGLVRSHRGQAYPAELRGRLKAEAVRLRRSGLTWYEVGRKLGVRGETVERWLSQPSPRSERSFRTNRSPIWLDLASASDFPLCATAS